MVRRTINLKGIVSLFAGFPGVSKVSLFGSRALGTETPHSDIDLAIRGALSEDDFRKLQTRLDDLPTPCKFDLIRYETIEHAPLRDHIDRVGKVLFSAPEG